MVCWCISFAAHLAVLESLRSISDRGGVFGKSFAGAGWCRVQFLKLVSRRNCFFWLLRFSCLKSFVLSGLIGVFSVFYFSALIRC